LNFPFSVNDSRPEGSGHELYLRAVNKTALYALLIALVLPVAAYLLVDSYSKGIVPMPRHYIYDSVVTRTEDGKQVTDTLWHRLPDFSFTNQLGKKVGWRDVEGKVTVAQFFFTHCPTICPRMMVNIKKLQEGISSGKKVGDNKATFVQFLSFTVDPERDSVPALKNWADRFGISPDNWWLLTGPKKEIYDLSINDMKLWAEDKGVDTGFLHTDLMVLIDKHQYIRGYYHALDTASIGKLSQDIILVSLEKERGRKKPFDGKLLLIIILGVLLVGGGIVFFSFLNADKRRHEFPNQKK
jgi:protein SCO1